MMSYCIRNNTWNWKWIYTTIFLNHKFNLSFILFISEQLVFKNLQTYFHLSIYKDYVRDNMKLIPIPFPCVFAKHSSFHIAFRAIIYCKILQAKKPKYMEIILSQHSIIDSSHYSKHQQINHIARAVQKTSCYNILTCSCLTFTN